MNTASWGVPLSSADAKVLVLCHAFAMDAADDPRVAHGFLGSLRPFQGELNERNFHEIMHCLRVLAPALSDAPALDRELISALWSICHLARTWALEPQGMLQSNHLLSPEQTATLLHWLELLGYAVFALLAGGSEEEAFFEYERTFPNMPLRQDTA